MSKKTALVFGGTRGIGAACVQKLAESGYDVAYTYISSAPGLPEQIGSSRTRGYSVDICDAAQVEQVDQVPESHRLDQVQVDADGRPIDVRIAHGTGNDELDAAAIDGRAKDRPSVVIGVVADELDAARGAGDHRGGAAEGGEIKACDQCGAVSNRLDRQRRAQPREQRNDRLRLNPAFPERIAAERSEALRKLAFTPHQQRFMRKGGERFCCTFSRNKVCSIKCSTPECFAVASKVTKAAAAIKFTTFKLNVFLRCAVRYIFDRIKLPNSAIIHPEYACCNKPSSRSCIAELR